MSNFWGILLFAIYYKTIYSLPLFDINVSNNNIQEVNIPPHERNALYDLYTSTNGIYWDYKGDKGHWNFTDPDVNPCLFSNTWQGLNCSSDGLISEIILSDYNLNGTLPISLGIFTKLQHLDLSYNKLIFNIPNSIGNLSELISLRLSYNSLNGKLPNSIYRLSLLQILDLSYNYHLVGTLSNLIGNLSQLQHLNLAYNAFEGTIPDKIGNLSELISMSLSYNSLNGKLPNSIYQLSLLQVLDLGSNYHLVGTLSNYIGNLTQLQYLNLRYNAFEGTIPDTIGNLSELIYLRLSQNQFIGKIPNSIRNLKSLQLLSFSFNELSGTIPHWVDDLTSILFFSLYGNHFHGNIQPTFSSTSNSSLVAIFYGMNQLTGTIPNWIGELTKFQILWLNNNQLTGSIPTIFSKLSLFRELRLSNNLLTGNITSIISNTQLKLHIFEVHSNHLTGTIPHAISNLQSLQTCFLQNNHFSGNLNGVFNGSYQKDLNNIQLSNNQFTGKLPEEIFSSQGLVSFSAVSNCFHGSIPTSICNNTKLETLALDGLVCAVSCRNKIIPSISSAYISDNKITGGIPHCLWSMPKLQVLHLSGNSLTGSLPDNINISTSLIDLSLSYNLLTGSIPSYIQERKWNNLDLSYNRISGILQSNYAIQFKDASLSLKNNRLSATIPNHLQNMKNISILKGNAYNCKYDRSDLPIYDKNRDTYECGSNTFNVLYYLWLVLILIIMILIILIWCYRDSIGKYLNISSLISKIWKWIYIMEYLKALNEVENNIIEMSYLKQYYSFHEIILRYSTYCTIFIIIILLPTYAIVSSHYATHTYEYAWTVSILYLSGKIAFGIIIAILILFVITQIYIFQCSVKQSSYTTEIHNKVKDKKFDRWRLYAMYITYIIINFIIVGGVNVGYLYVAFNQSNTIVVLTQILLSFFKITWNKIISPLILRIIFNYISELNVISRKIQRRLFMLQFVVSLFNNILIPCFIVAIVSPNCFYNLFQQESDVTSSFNYKACIAINLQLQCYEPITATSTTTYSPPFTYSYQCSSEFITYYAFIILLICIITTFIIPFGQILLIQLSIRYEWKSFSFIKFHDLWNNNPIHNNHVISVTSLLNMDDIYEILVSLLSLIGLLLTFGAIFPPLAVAILVAIYRRIYFHKIILGRYISNAMEVKAYSCLDIIEEDCKVIPLLSTIQLCGWVLLYVSCLFYTLFVFDILGDDVGVSKAYWVLIVMPCIPLFMHIIYKQYKCWLRYKDKKRNEQIDIISDNMIFNKSIEGIELTLNPLYINNNNAITTTNSNNESNIVDDIYVEDGEGTSVMIKDSIDKYINE